MAQEPPRRYVVEIDRVDPVSGRITDAEGIVQREFVGWLGIAAGLQEILALPAGERRPAG